MKTLSLSILTIAFAFVLIYLFTGSTNEEAISEAKIESFKEGYKVFALQLPKAATFANESVPTELIDVQEKFDRELHVNTYWQSQTILFIKRSNRWFPTIEKILAEEGVPEDFKYLSLIESGFQQVVSPAGATGYWQLMKSAAKENGLEVNGAIDERYHIEKSTYAACAYLKKAKERFGSWTLAAASYNMGMAGLAKQMERQKATNYYDLVLNEETSRYVFRILAAKTILSNPTDFGFTFTSSDLYQPFQYEEVVVTKTIDDLATFSFEHGINYKALKYLNPWLRDRFLPNASGKEYRLKIPTKALSIVLVNDKEQVITFTRENGDEGNKQEE